MLTSKEEADLLASLKFSSDYESWVALMYSCRTKKYEQLDAVAARLEMLEDPVVPSSKSTCNIKGSSDLIACKADYYYQRYVTLVWIVDTDSRARSVLLFD
eukprot:5318264-Ditylum_brightwellii.AAC.1